MKSDNSPRPLVRQYFVGLAINLAFVIILLSCPVSFRNLQIPEGQYADNAWKGMDIITYVRPARNFLEYGVFGKGTAPGYQRTVGYPLFLAAMMKLFGSNWLVGTIFVQAIAFALIYPALSKISLLLFPGQASLYQVSFWIYLMLGTFIAMVPMILTDLFFAVLFTVGVCFGIVSVKLRSWLYLLLYVVFVGYAAQVRPALMFYPFVNIFVLLASAKRFRCLNEGAVKAFVLVSTLCLLVLCNLPSLRNYVNYGLFKPTDVLERNMFYFLTRDVLHAENEQDVYAEMNAEVSAATDLQQKMTLMKEHSLMTYKQYPVTTLKRMLRNSAYVVNTHWQWAGRYWGYSRRDVHSPGHMPLKRSNLMLAIVVIGCIAYSVIHLFFAGFLLRLLRTRNWLYLSTILVVIGYFLGPTFIAGGGKRMYLPVEGIVVMLSVYEMRSFAWLPSIRN